MPPLLYPPLGKLYPVGSHQLHLNGQGTGSPVVILESGGGSWSMDWSLVQPEVARFTRVISYDRAGMGWSEPGPKPRTTRQIAKELHDLLECAGEKPPYILVGASFGGHVVRLFHQLYPGEAAGMLLLDARHESLEERMPPGWKKARQSGRGMNQVMGVLSRLNLLEKLGKLMGDRSLPPLVQKLAPEERQKYLAVGYRPDYFATNLAELDACPESDRQVSQAGDLGSLPLIVIRHAIPDLFTSLPLPERQQAEQTWQALQADLASRSTAGRLRVAEQSGHGIQIDQPEIVIGAILELVEMEK